MVIIAWNGSGDLGAVFEADVFKRVMSIFITAAILKFAQGIENLFISSNASRLVIYVKECALPVLHVYFNSLKLLLCFLYFHARIFHFNMLFNFK